MLMDANYVPKGLIDVTAKLIRTRQIERCLTESSPLADNFLPILASTTVTAREKVEAFAAFGALVMGREEGNMSAEMMSAEKQAFLREGYLLSHALREAAFRLHFERGYAV